jgi:hypothetical protein
LQAFVELAKGVDDAAWLYHLGRGDYSRWIRSVLKDTELADEIEKAEKAEASDPKGSRKQIQAAIEQRYTGPVREALVAISSIAKATEPVARANSYHRRNAHRSKPRW